MFRIVDDLFGMFLEVGHRRLDHVQVFFQGGADNVGHMQVPALAENGLYGSAGLYQGLQQRILFGQHLGTTGGAESGNLRMLQLDFLDFLEEFLIGGIAGVRPATFNVVKTETVQESCYLQLVRQGQTDFPILVTVAEGRIVQKNFHTTKDKKIGRWSAGRSPTVVSFQLRAL